MKIKSFKQAPLLYASFVGLLALSLTSLYVQSIPVYFHMGLAFVLSLLGWDLIGLTWPSTRSMEAADVSEHDGETARMLALSAIHSRIFHNAAVGIALVSQDGKPEITNGFFQQLLGYTGPELAKMHFAEFTHPLDAEIDVRHYQELLTGIIEDYQMEKRYIRKDGSVFWVLLSVSLSGDPNRQDTRAIAIVKDISQLKGLEASIANKDQTMKLFVEHTPAAVAMFDSEMRYMFTSQRWIEDYSLEGSDIIGRSHYEVFPEINDDDEWKEDHQRVLAGAIIKSDQDQFIRKDGSVDWVRYELHPWRNGDGDIGGLIMFTEVITDKVNLQHAIEDQKNRLASIFNHVKDIIGLLDSNGNYKELSPSVTSITGYEVDELIGKNPFEFWHPDDLQKLGAESVDMHMEKLMSNGDTEYRFRHRDGHYIWLESNVEKFEVEGRPVAYASSSRDITESHNIRIQLNESMDELNRTNKELKTFAYVASHDLQEPLRVITSYLQLIQRRFADVVDEKAHQYIGHTVQASERMKALINDLLALSRIESRELETQKVDPKEALDNLQRDLQLAIHESNAKITVGELPLVSADATQIQQLFQNLVANAIKFQEKGNAPEINIGAICINGMAEFSVEDNGIGIDPEFRDRIFTIFQRLHSRKAYSGTGIGLAISKKIVERHGGQIWVAEKITPGTLFKFTLPLHDRKTEASFRLQTATATHKLT